MAYKSKYPQELKERSVRLVDEARVGDPDLSLNKAFERIAARVGVGKDALRGWWRQAQVDSGKAPGVSTEEKRKIKELEAEVKELKRANEILLAASSFFARELDPRLPW